MIAPKRLILFIAEAVTLAHLARPLALALGLDPARYEIVVACDPRCRWLTDKYPLDVRPIASISGEAFLRALAWGRPVYSAAMLRAYVGDDLRLLGEVRPDLVVGDFRLSLSVSARIAGVPYMTISNGYWSPYVGMRYPVPSLPITRFAPLPLASLLFNLVRPLAFSLHARPLNTVRREYGLPSLGADLRRTYTDADWVAYADLPGLFPMQRAPANHRSIGPIVWAPPVEPSEWWQSLSTDRPLIYVTMGSSGRASLLPAVLASLAPLAVTVVAATAGNPIPGEVPRNCRVAAYLPGDEMARRAALVICNGGSPTTQQALTAGVPVLGIAENLDQFLNMTGIEQAGAGLTLRVDRFDPAHLRRDVQRLLAEPAFADAAGRIAKACAALDVRGSFSELVDEILGRTGGASGHRAQGACATSSLV